MWENFKRVCEKNVWGSFLEMILNCGFTKETFLFSEWCWYQILFTTRHSSQRQKFTRHFAFLFSHGQQSSWLFMCSFKKTHGIRTGALQTTTYKIFLSFSFTLEIL